MSARYFEEIAEGDTFRSPRRTITEADQVQFVTLCGLLDPLFVDETFAREQGLKGRLIPGPLTTCYAVGLTADLHHGTVSAALGLDNVRFHAPVYPGDTIEVETTVAAKRESRRQSDRGPVTLRHIVTNQRGEQVVSFERTLMWLKRP